MFAVTALLFVGWSAQSPTPASQTSALPDGPKLVSTMLAKYHNAKTLTAHIKMTQTAMGKSIAFDTDLVYERPQKIYLLQKRSDDPRYSPSLISDAVEFAYTTPPNVAKKGHPWFAETAHPKVGAINIEEMWPVAKVQIADGDLSFALMALISRVYDLKEAVPQLATCVNKGRVQIGNRLVNDIEGDWKSAGYGQRGTYSLYITDDGDLVRHEIKMAFAVNAQWLQNHKLSPSAFQDGIQTVTVWDVNATVDQPVNESLFTLPKNLMR